MTIIIEKTKKQITRCIIFAILIVISSCSIDDFVDVETTRERTEGRFSSTGLIKLGKKLNDPYSLENMQKAMDQLKQEGVLPVNYGEVTLSPTHKYLRFLPANEAEYYLLTDSFKLMLFDHCLLREVVEDGNYYMDPDIESGNITWQYTTVAVNFDIPDVAHEIIHYCYIPEETKSNGDNNFNTLLEERAVLLSGYFDHFKGFKEDEVTTNQDPLQI